MAQLVVAVTYIVQRVGKHTVTQGDTVVHEEVLVVQVPIYFLAVPFCPELLIQTSVLVVKVFTEPGGVDVSDLVLENPGDREPLFFEHVEEEHQLILPLFAVVNVFLHLNNLMLESLCVHEVAV